MLDNQPWSLSLVEANPPIAVIYEMILIKEKVVINLIMRKGLGGSGGRKANWESNVIIFYF